MRKNDTRKLAAFFNKKLDGKSLTELAPLFHMLSDLTRLRLLQALLTKGNHSVGDLVEELGIRQPVVSHHLSLLRLYGLVVNVKAGRNILYSVAE